jgi:glycosyltransferase involved in cell wall biosynthesis
MNILMITDNDPAGMGIAFTNAINRFSEHSCRLITTAEKYGFDYEKDIHIPDIKDDEFGEVEQLLKDVDIIHFHVLRDENSNLGPLVIRDYIKGKKIIHHHHGHPHFRANPDYYREKHLRLKRKVLVSTPDLLKLVPEASWLPNLVPLENPLLKPQPCEVNGKVVIGQAPTRKELKNTKELVAIVTELQCRKTSPALELKIFERLRHKQCLGEKNKCHIIFDHMQGYYGVSSLESLSQGKPVIAGLDAWNELNIKEFTGCEELPWVLARNGVELEARLKALVSKAEFRDRIGQRSRTFMENHWTEQYVLELLFKAYGSL